ncbi:MAG TPA: hypothetical protein VGE15_08115, partial [Sphingobacteriaceae bacterium]
IHALRDAGVSQATLEQLADADAFRSLGFDRRQALWEISSLHDRPVALFKGQPSASVSEPQINLPFMTTSEHVVHDYATTSLSLKAHPVLSGTSRGEGRSPGESGRPGPGPSAAGNSRGRLFHHPGR